MVAQLIKIFPTILWKIQIVTKFNRLTLEALTKHEYSKSILIQFVKIHFNVILLYIHTGLLNGLFTSHFPITNLFTITFIPMHATFLTHFVTVLWFPTTWQAVQFNKLHIIHPSPLSSSVFSSNIIPIILFSNNHLLNGKKHSPVLQGLFLCYSFQAFSYNPYFNQQNERIKKQ